MPSVLHNARLRLPSATNCLSPTACRCFPHDSGAGARDADANTPLFWAIQKGHLKVAELLVKKGGAQVDARNAADLTPLSMAVITGEMGALHTIASDIF